MKSKPEIKQIAKAQRIAEEIATKYGDNIETIAGCIIVLAAYSVGQKHYPRKECLKQMKEALDQDSEAFMKSQSTTG